MEKNTTIGTRHLRTKIAIGYALILLLVGGIVYIWLSERKDMATLKAENERISDFRKEIHSVYVQIAELSLMGETILEWDNEDVTKYRRQRLAVDSLLCRFKAVYPAERIDSIRHLLEDKEALLRGIKQVLDKQEAINADSGACSRDSMEKHTGRTTETKAQGIPRAVRKEGEAEAHSHLHDALHPEP